MKNQQTHRSETSVVQAKKGNGGKILPTAGLGLGIISTAFAIIWLTLFADVSSSRPSTHSEIDAQIELQEKWNTAQKKAEQKWDSTLKADDKPESNGK